MGEQKKYTLTSETQKELDRWLAKYPSDQRRSAVVIALRLVQVDNGGWVSDLCMQAIAEYLKIPAIYVYEAATFYDMIELSPQGKHKICVCTNLSCQLRGSKKIVSHLKKRLGIGLGETTSDGKITLKEVECMAACVDAPMCQVDDKAYHLNLTEEKVDAILTDLGVGGAHDNA